LLPQTLPGATEDLHQFLTGKVGKAAVQMDLTVGTDWRGSPAHGSYFYAASTGGRLELKGTNRFEAVSFTEFTDDDPPKATGHWQGQLEHGRFTGTWKSPDGRRSLAFDLRSVVSYHAETASTPRYTATLTWPVFTNGAFGRAVTAEVEKTLRADKAEFVDLIKNPENDSFAGKRYSWDDDWRIEYFADGFVSLRRYYYEDVGQAGGNHGVARLEGHTFIKTATGARRLTEKDFLRRPGSWKGVDGLVFKELRRRGAQYVCDGQLKSGDDLDLSQFTLNRMGITFHFGSYAVAAYPQGTFEAFIPFKDLQDWLRPEFKVP
jgi:hypothetical protein